MDEKQKIATAREIIRMARDEAVHALGRDLTAGYVVAGMMIQEGFSIYEATLTPAGAKEVIEGTAAKFIARFIDR